MKVPVPSDYRPPSISMVECHVCQERVAFDHALKERLDVTDTGWRRHRHQPQGPDKFKDVLSGRMGGKLRAEDFRS